MPSRFALLPLAGTSLLLAACNASEEPEQPAAPAPVLTPNPVATVSAEGQALTPGSWTIEETAGGASAAFGQPGAAPSLVLVCNAATGAVSLRHGAALDEPEVFMLEAGGQRAGVRMTPTEGTLSVMEAEIDPTQPIFAAFADPAASIRVTAPGTEALLIPAHQGLNRVVEACS